MSRLFLPSRTSSLIVTSFTGMAVTLTASPPDPSELHTARLSRAHSRQRETPGGSTGQSESERHFSRKSVLKLATTPDTRLAKQERTEGRESSFSRTIDCPGPGMGKKEKETTSLTAVACSIKSLDQKLDRSRPQQEEGKDSSFRHENRAEKISAYCSARFTVQIILATRRLSFICSMRKTSGEPTPGRRRKGRRTENERRRRRPEKKPMNPERVCNKLYLPLIVITAHWLF